MFSLCFLHTQSVPDTQKETAPRYSGPNKWLGVKWVTLEMLPFQQRRGMRRSSVHMSSGHSAVIFTTQLLCQIFSEDHDAHLTVEKHTVSVCIALRSHAAFCLEELFKVSVTKFEVDILDSN